MPTIYCTKCGVRGSSKCPHCRSIFSNPKPKLENGETDYMKAEAQEFFEMFASVKIDTESMKNRKDEHDDVRHFVSFWTYAQSESEALEKTLERLKFLLPLTNIKVAACVHDWAIAPGEKSSIGCGHEGDPSAVMPPDPFA